MVKLAHWFAVKALKRKNKKQNTTVLQYGTISSLKSFVYCLESGHSCWFPDGLSQGGNHCMKLTGRGNSYRRAPAVRKDGQVPWLPVSQHSVRPGAKQNQLPLPVWETIHVTHTHSPHLLLSSSRPLFLLPCSFSILSSACFSAALSFSFIISCSPSAHILICSFPPAYFHPLFYSASSLLFFSLFPPHFLYANDFRHLFPLLHSHLLFTSSSSLFLYFMLVLHTFSFKLWVSIQCLTIYCVCFKHHCLELFF